MNDQRDGYDDAWFDRLDSIVEGGHQPSPDDDELLYVAGQLVKALSPLKELDGAAETRRQRLGARLHAQLVTMPPPRYRWQQTVNVALVLVIFLLLGPGIMFALNPGAVTTIFNLPGNASTTTPGLSSSPAPPADQLIDYSQYPLGAWPVGSSRALTLYQATWLVDGHYIYMTWEADDPPDPHAKVPPGLTTVYIGSIKALADHNNAGQNILEWYQRGYDFRLISDLPLEELISFARHLKPNPISA